MKKLRSRTAKYAALSTLVFYSSISTAYDYTAYSRDYVQCTKDHTGALLPICQKNAKIRYECARTADENACWEKNSADLLNADLLEYKKREKAQFQASKNQQAEKEAAWVKTVAQRTDYGTGSWVVIEREPDPIDDSKVVTAVLDASSGKENLGGERISLTLRCSSNKTVMYINWGDYVTDSTRVTHRFDKEKPITKEWDSSTDKTASFYYGSGHSIAKKLMVTDKFVARTTPYNESPTTAIFDTKGLSKAIGPLRQACSW